MGFFLLFDPLAARVELVGNEPKVRSFYFDSVVFPLLVQTPVKCSFTSCFPRVPPPGRENASQGRLKHQRLN